MPATACCRTSPARSRDSLGCAASGALAASGFVHCTSGGPVCRTWRAVDGAQVQHAGGRVQPSSRRDGLQGGRALLCAPDPAGGAQVLGAGHGGGHRHAQVPGQLLSGPGRLPRALHPPPRDAAQPSAGPSAHQGILRQGAVHWGGVQCWASDWLVAGLLALHRIGSALPSAVQAVQLWYWSRALAAGQRSAHEAGLTPGC